ncbi:MAG: FtsQ-type POTRA domain-containing protein [Clostridiales bacterium]|nr:FtsQ-type POTRA domain-containing protein [Clostridiales bacterium]
MANRGGRAGKKIRKIHKTKTFLIVTCLTLGTLVFFALPFFHIKTVNIIGAGYYTREQILSEMGLDNDLKGGDSIFYRTASSMAKGLNALPYIREASIEKNYPDGLTVTVLERSPRGYILDDKLGVYLCIDEEGVVLDIKSEIDGNLPVITGLRFSGYEAGKVLQAENTDAFDSMVKLAELFKKYDITDVAMADVSDSEDIRLFIGNVEAYIGSIAGADYSVNWVRNCLAELDPNIRGTLHAENSDNTILSLLQ